MLSPYVAGVLSSTALAVMTLLQPSYACAKAGATPAPLSTGAQSAAPGAPNPGRPAAQGSHERSGLYLRLAAGIGVFRDESQTRSGAVKRSAGGVDSAFEAAAGGTLGRGVVVGAGAFVMRAATASVRDVTGSSMTLDAAPSPALRTLTLYGPFVDLYLNPARGWHAQLALGVADIGDIDGDYSAGGLGLMLGVGYEARLCGSYSAGLLLRSMLVGAKGKDSSGTEWDHSFSGGPQLLMSFSYH